MVVVEPLPLVPAINTERKARSGWPRWSIRAEMFPRPSVIAEGERPRTNLKLGGRSGERSGNGRRLRAILHFLFRYGNGPRAHEVEHPFEGASQLVARNDHVDHAVLEQELAALEAFREVLSDCLL